MYCAGGKGSVRVNAALYHVNEGKRECVGEGGHTYHCYAVKTKLVTNLDALDDIVDTYVKPLVCEGDIVFLSEKMVACTQGRAIAMADIKPGFWATTLSRYVVKTPGGIGLGMPETMQCAIDECGLPRILLAAAVGALGKVLHRKGWFYHVAGYRAAAIDGPCHWTIPPYNHYVVLAPEKPDAVARAVSAKLGGNLVLVVDLNDFGGKILGKSDAGADEEALLPLLKQNPLGQTDECTPVGILRPWQRAETVEEMAACVAL